MQKYKYDKSFSLGTIASSGTFAAMIPPSYGLIVYAIFTGVSIGRLFLAGIIPGLITATVYSLSIILRVKFNPKLAPKLVSEDYSIKDKMKPPIIFTNIIIVSLNFGMIFPATNFNHPCPS